MQPRKEQIFKKLTSAGIPEKTIISGQFVKIVDRLIADGKFNSYRSFAEYYGHAKSLIAHIRSGRQDVSVELLYEVVLDWKINPYYVFGIGNEIYD